MFCCCCCCCCKKWISIEMLTGKGKWLGVWGLAPQPSTQTTLCVKSNFTHHLLPYEDKTVTFNVKRNYRWLGKIKTLYMKFPIRTLILIFLYWLPKMATKDEYNICFSVCDKDFRLWRNCNWNGSPQCTRPKITLSRDDLVINIVCLGLTPMSVLDVNRASLSNK